MKLKDLTKTYPVALGSAIGLLIFGGLAAWRSNEFDDLKARLETQEQESERLSANVHNSAKLNAQLEQLNNLTTNIQAKLTNPSDLAANQQFFYKLEADNKVKLSELKQQVALTRGAKKKAYTFYSTVSYSLKVQGDYQHVLQFARSIESGSRLAVVETAYMDTSGVKKDEEISEDTPMALTLNLQLLATP